MTPIYYVCVVTTANRSCQLCKVMVVVSAVGEMEVCLLPWLPSFVY